MPQSFNGLEKPSSTGVMSFIHPLTALSFGTASLPSDLSLESADALSTYRAFNQVESSDPVLDATTLNPTVFFGASKMLTQKDILHYEAALKDALNPLLVSSNAQDPKSGLRGLVESLASPTLAATDADVLNTPPDGGLLRTGLIYLLSDLKSTGDLVCSIIHVLLSD